MKHMVEDTHRHQEKKEKKEKSLAAKELKEDRPPRQPKEGILFPHPRPLVVTANAFSFSFPFISISFPIGFVFLFFLALFQYIYIYGQTQKRIQFFLGSCDSLNASTITKIAGGSFRYSIKTMFYFDWCESFGIRYFYNFL